MYPARCKLDTVGNSIKACKNLCNLKYIFGTAFGKAFGLNLWKSDMVNAYGMSGAGGLRDTRHQHDCHGQLLLSEGVDNREPGSDARNFCHR